MSNRWRYGLAVDLVVAAWAVAMCMISLVTISGVVDVGLGWEALAIVLLGVLAFVVTIIGLGYTICSLREARDEASESW